MEAVLMFATILMPIVTAVVELAKRTIMMAKNIVPVVSLVLGLALGAAAYPFTDLDLTMRLWAGGFAGLAATGLFEVMNKRLGVTKTK